MSIVKMKNVEPICRICLDNTVNSYSIYEPRPNNPNSGIKIVDEIFFCTNLQIEENSRCFIICKDCLINLTIAVNFKKQCHNAQRVLLGVLKNFMNENENFDQEKPDEDVEFIESYEEEKKEDVFIDENHFTDADVLSANIMDIVPDEVIARKEFVQQITQNDAELFSIEPVNINLNYDCEKDISVFTIGNESNSGITTESSGCTVVQPVDPVNFGKKKMRHKCSYCGILTNDLLTHHLLTHQDDEMEEKTFPCSLCVRTFATDGRFKCHFASHTREKNFICPVCSKNCASKYTLSSHMRIHGIYQEIFSCDICQKTFRAKGEIVPHKQLVHDIDPHENRRRKKRGGPYKKKQKIYN